MNEAAVFVVSGLPPGDSGTGRLITHLKIGSAGLHPAVKLFARPDPWLQVPGFLKQRQFRAAGRLAIRYLIGEPLFRRGVNRVRRNPSAPLLILHPQTLGYRLTVRLIEERSAPAALFLLDSSFFCVASYNHVSGEHVPCERCLGGDFSAATRMGCAPFPKPDPDGYDYTRALRDQVRRGKVIPIAQNARQAELAQRHFGLKAPPSHVGLWTADLDVILAQRGAADRGPAPATAGEAPWDVVYHGFDLEAKGARWLEEVAGRLPARRFMFPMARPQRRSPPANCQYQPMTWESGLAQAVGAARMTVVPSLWSAPIEGALVKSIAISRATAVIDNPSAYAGELPDDLILKLPSDPVRAGAALERALSLAWCPAPEARSAWFDLLERQRSGFLANLLAAVAMGSRLS